MTTSESEAQRASAASPQRTRAERNTTPRSGVSGVATSRTPGSARKTGTDDPGQTGKIRVSAQAIATIAGRAVAESYGVVGVAAKRTWLGQWLGFWPGDVRLVAPEEYARGVDVRFRDDSISIDVNVVLEHGLRVSEIAHNIMTSVKFAVEEALGVRVVRVNVNVLALRVE
ncbi:MAG TPA: Asp23/Gls24 family envelope stress response protein [Ktedonobacterales bacterium]|nr:Asp23/Gls24 family envelope stress response protein [Ktedonobacterales bacterium]